MPPLHKEVKPKKLKEATGSQRPLFLKAGRTCVARDNGKSAKATCVGARFRHWKLVPHPTPAYLPPVPCTSDHVSWWLMTALGPDSPSCHSLTLFLECTWGFLSVQRQARSQVSGNFQQKLKFLLCLERQEAMHPCAWGAWDGHWHLVFQYNY